MSGRIFFHSPSEYPTGYGVAARGLKRGLAAIGADLTDEPDWDDVQVTLAQPVYVRSEMEDRRATAFEKTIHEWWTVKRKCETQLFFTMFECTSLPPGWVEEINRREGLIVPSRWCADGFRAQGVTVPIYVVSLGIDPEQWTYIERPSGRPLFTFFWQGVHFDDRKGGALVQRTFEKLRASGQMPDARLVMKWTTMWSRPWRYEGRHLLQIGEWISDQDLEHLVWQADCSVNPTTGEGFGLMPLEHMATGLPTIVTAATGQLDYMEVNDQGTSHVCLPLKGELNVDRLTAERDSVNLVAEYLPDEEHLAELMLWCYQNQDAARALGGRASQWARQWTWERSARMLIEKVEEHLAGSAEKPQEPRSASTAEADTWIGLHGEPGPAERLRAMADAAEGTVLDVGSGNARTVEMLMARGLTVTCLDHAPAGLGRARVAGAKTVEHDFTKPLPFDDGAFDTVLAGEVLEHCESPAKLMAELERVARKRIVISLPVGLRHALEESTHRWLIDAKLIDISKIETEPKCVVTSMVDAHLVLVLERIPQKEVRNRCLSTKRAEPVLARQ